MKTLQHDARILSDTVHVTFLNSAHRLTSADSTVRAAPEVAPAVTTPSAPPRSGATRYRRYTDWLFLDQIHAEDRVKFKSPGYSAEDWLRGEVVKIRNGWVHIRTDSEGGRVRHRRAHKLKWDEDNWF